MAKSFFKVRHSDAEGTQTVQLLPIDWIYPNPSQPRVHFDEVDIVSLADSIRRHGLLQPISVRPSSKNDENAARFYVIAGERRLRAFKMLGKSEIPCLIFEASPQGSAELALVENIMRKDLDLFEYAKALSALIEKYDMTQEELAARLSTSQSNIANKLRLLRFSAREQRLILDSNLSERHARALLRLEDPALRLKAIHQIAAAGWNVKKSEEYIDRLLLPLSDSSESDTAPDCNDILRRLKNTLSSFEKQGLPVLSEREENENEVRFIIRIPKSDIAS